jgi:transposase, IS5 family
MIDARRTQSTFADKLIAEEVDGLYEDWMVHADAVLADDAIVMAAYEALAKRHRLSRTRDRRGFCAEVVVRLLVLKHARNWSYAVLEREVRANLIYRKFTRVGFAKMADAKTMGKWGVAVGPEVVKQIHERIVSIAKEKGLSPGAKMRVDTTVVETNIHYPTDSSLLGDGVRVLTRVMKKITKIVGEAGCKLRDRTRSVKHRVMEIGRAARAVRTQGKDRLHKAYANLDAACAPVRPHALRWPG